MTTNASSTEAAETTCAPALGLLQLNTSNGKVFINATVPAEDYQASTSFELAGWAPELPYAEVGFTAAGLTEEDEAHLVAAGYEPVMGLVRGVLATAIAPAPAADAPGYLFVDFESTGLPAHRDGTPNEHFVPLQVAAAVVSPDLEVVATYEAKINASPEQLASMDEFVVNMHTTTGLLAALEAGEGRDLEVVDAELAAFIAEHSQLLGDEKGKYEMAGNSVSGVDAPVMTGFFRAANASRSHRVIDVSSTRRTFLRYAPTVDAAFADSGRKHDAFADILGCLTEYRQQTRAGYLLSEGFARTQR